MVASLFSICLTPAAVASDVNAMPSSIPGRGTFSEAMLTEHNAERAKLGIAPLFWSVELSSDARTWAEKLANEKIFEHAYAEVLQKKQGENLWMGTAGEFAYAEMAALWLDEHVLMKSGRFPDVSKTGKWEDVGHYTQMIWADTRQVGCAIAKNNIDEFVVCRYFPAGNVLGVTINLETRKQW